MAIKSTLVNCTAASTVKKYELKLNSKINSNSFALDSKANQYYNAILTNYSKIKSLFTSISSDYSACEAQALEGADLKKAVKKIATASKHQGECCGKRREDLKEAYRYAKLQKMYEEVLAKLIKAGIK